MSKYLFLWESNINLMPANPTERAALIGKQIEMTKQALKDKKIIDWGLYASGNAGYAIGEGTTQDALKGAMQFDPYVKFQTIPVLSIDEVADVMKSMMG